MEMNDYNVINDNLVKNTDVYMSKMMYDEVCHLLTDYEEGTANGSDLYNKLVEIQNGYDNCHFC